MPEFSSFQIGHHDLPASGCHRWKRWTQSRITASSLKTNTRDLIESRVSKRVTYGSRFKFRVWKKMWLSLSLRITSWCLVTHCGRKARQGSSVANQHPANNKHPQQYTRTIEIWQQQQNPSKSTPTRRHAAWCGPLVPLSPLPAFSVGSKLSFCDLR